MVTSGTATARVQRPSTVAATAELLRDSAGPVLFRGGGTAVRWGGRPVPPDLVVETTGLDRLIAHNAGDMTAAVGAGMPLGRLQETLGAAGQWLAIDPPSEAAGATIGGVLASGDYGPRRLRYGAMRDLVIGVTLVLADGTVARSGGHVIKNVAGYDLSRLMYGSLGTLALVGEVVLRLHPRPEASATVLAPADARAATAATLALMASPLEPSSVEWLGGDPSGGRLAVRLEGSADGVTARLAGLHDLLTAAGLRPERLAPADEEKLWLEVATATGGGTDTVAAAGTLPSRTADVERELAKAADTAGVHATLTSHLALGLHIARFTGNPADLVNAFDAWRRRVVSMGGTVLLRDRPAEVDAAVDPLGPPPSAVQLLRRIKRQLDPDDRCAPGRFGSWY